MTPTPPWIIRPYRADDETALVALFARVFGRPMTEAHWRWKLAPVGSPVPVVFLAVSTAEPGQERVLFQCAAMPVRYRGPGGTTTGLVAVDAMTDPAFRRQGLMTTVNAYAYEYWREAGMPFVIGLPNEQWGSRTRALGWREVGRLAWRLRPLRPDRIIGARFGAPIGRLMQPASRAWVRFWKRRVTSEPGIQVRRVASAEAFGDLWQRLEATRPAPASWTIVRDGAWIERRYLSAPDVDYRVWVAWRSGTPAGYCVSRARDTAGRRLGYIAEAAAVHGDAVVLRALLAAAVDDLEAAGAEIAAALAMPGSATDTALRRAGFLFSWGTFSVQMVPLRPDGLFSFSEIQGGDFDVV